MNDNVKKQRLSYKKELMLFCLVGGIIFTLFFMFVLQIPSIIKAGNGWTLIIVIPILFWINRNFYLGLVYEWKFPSDVKKIRKATRRKKA